MSGRYFLIFICILQLVTTAERQVFDFLGYMWTPIITNFIHIIVIIVCLFGAYQFRPRFIFVYTLFGVFWISWNVFIICFYLNIGSLNREKNLNLLNLSAGGRSWWAENGAGCLVTHNYTGTLAPESSIHSCAISYQFVEVLHAGIQGFLSGVGVAISCVLVYQYWRDDDTLAAVTDNELEYVKMRYKPPSRSPYPNPYAYHLDLPHPIAPVNNAFDAVSVDDEPPSYRDSVPDIATPVNDRRSMRSQRSAKSTRSVKSTRGNKHPAGRTQDKKFPDPPPPLRRDLPWVQITPSRNYNEVELRGYEGHFV